MRGAPHRLRSDMDGLSSTAGNLSVPPGGSGVSDALASATLAVSSDGPVTPGAQESTAPDLGTLQALALIANGKAPLPGETTPSPAAEPTPAVPQVDPVQQKIAALEAQLQAQQQFFLEQQQRAMQAQQQPREPTPQEYAAIRAREIQAAGLDPSKPENQALFDLHYQNQQVTRQMAEMQQQYAAMQARAQQITMEQQLAPAVTKALSDLGIQNAPPAVQQDVLARAMWYAQNGDRNALQNAIAPYAALIPVLRAPAPAAAPPPRLAALQGGAPNPLDAVSVQGKGAGRAPRAATLAEITALVSR